MDMLAFLIIFLEGAMAEFPVKSFWLEIACPTSTVSTATARWADPKSPSGSVQCCGDDGMCKRKNDKKECYSPGAVKYYVAKKICENAGRRLCTKAEIFALTCCDTGCKTNPKLVWTSESLGTVSQGGAKPISTNPTATQTVAMTANVTTESARVCQTHSDCPDDEGCIGPIADSNEREYTCEKFNCGQRSGANDRTSVAKWMPAIRHYCCHQGLLPHTVCDEVTTNVTRSTTTTDNNVETAHDTVTPVTTTRATGTTTPVTTTIKATTITAAITATTSAVTPPNTQVITDGTSQPKYTSLAPTTTVTTAPLCPRREDCPDDDEVCVDVIMDNGNTHHSCEKTFCLEMSGVTHRANLNRWAPALRDYCCQQSLLTHIECNITNATTGTVTPTITITARAFQSGKKLLRNDVIVVCIVVGVTSIGALALIYLTVFLFCMCFSRKRVRGSNINIGSFNGDMQGDESQQPCENQMQIELHLDQPY